MKNSLKLKITLCFLVITVITISLLPGNLQVEAKTLEEIQQEIDEQQKLIDQTNKALEDAKKSLDDQTQTLNSVQSGLPQIEAELKQIQSKIEFNSLQLKVLNETKKLKELEKDERETRQKQSLKNSYKEWRSRNPIAESIIETSFDLNKNEQYTAVILADENDGINVLGSDLNSIIDEVEEYTEELNELDKLNAELETKKRDLEAQIAYYNSLIAQTSNGAASLENTKNKATSNIALLQEQRQAAIKEAQQQEQTNGQTGTNPNTPADTQSGYFYIVTKGRDLYQGHGVGFSQWGAHGMASKGMKADEIAKYYFQNVTLSGGYESRTINVQGYGEMSIEDYVSGLGAYNGLPGEVPARACGNAEQIQANPNKYSSSGCWPEESIKAMAIVYRTYALYYVNNYGPICTSSACQVYNGSKSTEWAAQETRGQVLTYGGNPIEAVYSADNNQGSGTANNDTIWQNIHGDGTYYPYLRSVNDNHLATHTSWTNWTNRSQFKYNNNSIEEMLNYTANQSTYTQSVKSAVADVMNSIGGDIKEISFERDPSGRVKKVWFKGPNNVSRSIGGWWFKNIWNNWAYEKGSYDYIYSQTITLQNE